MRRVLLVGAIAGLTIGLTAGPAFASAPVHHHSSNMAAEAFWQSRVRLSPSTFKLTSWDVGVFSSSGRTFSFLFKEVAKCRVVSGHRRCHFVSFSVGQVRLSASQFAFDRKHLDSAHVAATYRLRTFLPGGKRGRTFTVKFVAGWTGVGKISRDGGTSNFRSACFRFHNTFKDRNRSAAATGSVNGKSLGTTRRAVLSAGTSLTIVRTCTS